MTATSAQRPLRQRNPRGQGERLRNDIIEAASRLLEDPAPPPLSLRSVARAVGVAATSVYLHFDDVGSLARAVADRHFGELVRRLDEASAGLTDPCARVHAQAMAYCEFGLAHPGQYQIMFSNPLPLLPPGKDGRPDRGIIQEQVPAGQAAQDRVVGAIAECLDCPAGDAAFRTAVLVWQQLHGAVNLRISRPLFPWPPLADTVTDAVDRLLAGARAEQQAEAL